MGKANPQVDGFIRKSPLWQAELKALRGILHESELVEEVKWRVPCYTVDGGNVVILGRFNDSCVISFVKGVLLKDAKGILEKPGENTQSARVVRFRDVEGIVALEKVLKAYIEEAIGVERAGMKVAFKKITEFAVPEELQRKLEAMPGLKKAFSALTPGRQRLYLMHISGAKQAKTREARVEKCVPRILDGKGLDDD